MHAVDFGKDYATLVQGRGHEDLTSKTHGEHMEVLRVSFVVILRVFLAHRHSFSKGSLLDNREVRSGLILESIPVSVQKVSNAVNLFHYLLL